MRTVNSVTLLGNIARLPERRITSGGKSFATFVLVTHQESPRDRNAVSSPEFHNIVAWGPLGTIAENFCKKGRPVYVEGYLKTRSWSHENGAKVFKTEIVASNIIAMGNESKNEKFSAKRISFGEFSEKDFFGASHEDFFDTNK